MKNARFLRILDANFNRSREGLRVCEEVARFLLNDKPLTASLKKSRHQITDVLKSFSVLPVQLIAERNAAGDVGKEPNLLEKKRGDVSDLFFANIQRSKESLRVLEEVSKLFDKKASDKLKRIRFKVYDIEKKSLPSLEALHHH